jgi:3',5'-cyclic AMP phosphodiesterase CpdA
MSRAPRAGRAALRGLARRGIRRSVLLGVGLAAAIALAAAGAVPSGAVPAGPPAEVTFFVVSDPHFNDNVLVPELSPANRAVIEALNGLPGQAWPPGIGGVVAAPRGVLVLGDLTDGGKPVQWRGRWFWPGGFDFHYPRDGAPGAADRVRWPVYALPGNHDATSGRTVVAEALARRYGSPRYALDWGPLRLLVVGQYPDAESLRWLTEEFERTPAGRPVVLFQHYSFPGSAFGGGDDRWWTAQEKEQFKAAIDRRGVVAIVHGHSHAPESYWWNEFPALNPGSAEHNLTILVVRAGESRMDVAWYRVRPDSSGRWTGGAWIESGWFPLGPPP